VPSRAVVTLECSRSVRPAVTADALDPTLTGHDRVAMTSLQTERQRRHRCTARSAVRGSNASQGEVGTSRGAAAIQMRHSPSRRL
jgi:hypothetical protein